MILSCIYVHKACVDQILTVWLSEDVNLLLRFFVKLLYPVRERKYIPNPWGSIVINLRRLDLSFNGETCRHRPSIMLLQTPIFLPLPCLKKKKKRKLGWMSAMAEIHLKKQSGEFSFHSKAAASLHDP